MRRIAVAGTAILLMIPSALPQGGRPDVFARQNLMAWCIVPFDAAHRGPVERARMLKRLGITMLAYDWREKDIPAFGQEFDALREEGIALQGFWLRTGVNPENDKTVPIVLDALKSHGIRTQLWCPLDPDASFLALPQEEKYVRATRALRYLAEQAGKIDCSVGFYSHGGWMGDPDHQLEILKRAEMKNTGLVYNFEHGRDHMDRFAEFFPKMVPHLMAVILNGMRKGAPAALTVGEGDRDLAMLKVIRDSGYRGPVGIMNLDASRDAEVGLQVNMEGLKKMLRQLGDTAALQTYD